MQTKYLLQLLFVLAICATAIAGSYHYSKLLHKKYLATEVKEGNSSSSQGSATQAEEKAEAVGHIFWESVTRLIISAKK
jgi:hypothetical protein